MRNSYFFGALAVLAVLVRFSNYDFALNAIDGHLSFIDTDCYYHLRRFVHFIENFPTIMTFDPLVNWPVGGQVDWPEGMLLLYGLPLKLFSLLSSFSTPFVVEWGSQLITFVLAFVSVCFFVKLSSKLALASIYQKVAVFGFVVSGLFIRHSSLGYVDHHLVEMMGSLILLYFGLRAFEDRSSVYWSIALGVLNAFLFSFSSSALFVTGALFLSFFFVKASLQYRRAWLFYSGSLVLTLALYFTLTKLVLHRDWISMMHPSLFQVSLALLLGVIGFLACQFEKRKCFVLGGFAILSVLLYFFGPLSATLQNAVQYSFGAQGVIASVTEASPIFMVLRSFSFSYILQNLGLLILIAPLALLQVFFSKSESHKFFLAFFVVLMIPGFAQQRFAPLMLGPFCLWVGYALWDLHRWMDLKALRTKSLATVGVMVLVMAPALTSGGAPTWNPWRITDYSILRAFFETEKFDATEVTNRLALTKEPDGGIWVTPNLGHAFLYLTGLGVVSNSFYQWPGLDKDLQLRLIENEGQLIESIYENRLKYLVLTDDFIVFKLQFDLRGQEAPAFFNSRFENGQEVHNYNIYLLEDYAWVRWLMRPQNQAEGRAQFLFSHFVNQPYFYRNVTAYKIAE